MSEANTQEEASGQKLYDDPETGEKVSKTELKRRQKQREAEKKKAEKAAAQAATGVPTRTAKTKAAATEEELDPTKYFENRSARINQLRESKDPIPYPHKFHVNTHIPEFIEKFSHVKTGEKIKEEKICLGARIMNVRSAGSSLVFYDCKEQGKSLQILCDSREAAEGKQFPHDDLKRGDWIGVTGYPGRTAPKGRPEGELSVFATEIILLAPCLHHLPSAHYGFRDQEQRYRQRYLDLIMNDDTREVFITRTKIISYLRRYLSDKGFLEVQTPMMNKIPGGANAKPFKTFHNDLDMELFLRVAPELYLKMLLVGGLEKVFEIGRQFRNEDIDLTHSPEFTSCEFYWTFADVYDVMDLTEDLISGMVKEVTGSYVTKLDKEGTTFEINWERPWKRIPMIPKLEEITGEKFPPADQLGNDESIVFLEGLLKKHDLICDVHTAAKMIDKLVGELIEPTCVNPTFITGHPITMSPLAKPDRAIPGICERFEMFAATKELCNAYTELNDPVIQKNLFLDQAKDKAKGDDESMFIDETFVQALEFGLPPCAGWGLGLDRLVMFLTNKYNIKEVLTFPMLREHDHAAKDIAKETPSASGAGAVVIKEEAAPAASK